MELLQHSWSLEDVVARMAAAGYDSIGRGRLSQIRREPVESIKGEVIIALADGLGVSPLTVANAALASMGIDPHPDEVTDTAATLAIDPTLSEANRRAVLALITVMRKENQTGDEA